MASSANAAWLTYVTQTSVDNFERMKKKWNKIFKRTTCNTHNHYFKIFNGKPNRKKSFIRQTSNKKHFSRHYEKCCILYLTYFLAHHSKYWPYFCINNVFCFITFFLATHSFLSIFSPKNIIPLNAQSPAQNKQIVNNFVEFMAILSSCNNCCFAVEFS